MNTYKINFEYTIPQFTEIEVVADSAKYAEEQAHEIFEMTYPEAVDPLLLTVTRL